MKPKMSRARVMAYSAILRKGHSHKSKKDYDRKDSNKKVAKELKEL